MRSRLIPPYTKAWRCKTNVALAIQASRAAAASSPRRFVTMEPSGRCLCGQRHMGFVLEFDGVVFRWQKQAIDRDRLVRWLRWRQPPVVELCRGGRCCRLRWDELIGLLLRPDPVEQAYRTLHLPPGSEE